MPVVWLSGPILVGKGRAVPLPVASKAHTLYCGGAWGAVRAIQGSCRCLHAPPLGVARQGGGAGKIGENRAQKKAYLSIGATDEGDFSFGLQRK